MSKYIKLNTASAMIIIIILSSNLISNFIERGFNEYIIIYNITPILIIMLSASVISIKFRNIDDDISNIEYNHNKGSVNKYVPVTFGTPIPSALMYIKDHDKLYNYFIKIAYGHLSIEKQNKYKKSSMQLYYNTLYERVEKSLLNEDNNFILRTNNSKSIVYTIRVNFTINDTNAIPIINIEPLFIEHNIIPFKKEYDLK